MCVCVCVASTVKTIVDELKFGKWSEQQREPLDPTFLPSVQEEGPRCHSLWFFAQIVRLGHLPEVRAEVVLELLVHGLTCFFLESWLGP